MDDPKMTLDDLIHSYHRACKVIFNAYAQIRAHNAYDERLDRLGLAFNKHSALMNLYSDLKKRQNETRKSD